MVTNLKNIKVIFTLFLICWAIMLLLLSAFLLLFRVQHFIIYIAALLFICYSAGFYYIRVITIDATGLGVTYYSQPYVLACINLYAFRETKEINLNTIQSIAFSKGLLPYILLFVGNRRDRKDKKSKKRVIKLNLAFFDDTAIDKTKLYLKVGLNVMNRKKLEVRRSYEL